MQVLSMSDYTSALAHLFSAIYDRFISVKAAHVPKEDLLCFAEADMWPSHWWS